MFNAFKSQTLPPTFKTHIVKNNKTLVRALHYTGRYCSRRPSGKIPYSFGPRVRSARMANITLSDTRESTPCKTHKHKHG